MGDNEKIGVSNLPNQRYLRYAKNGFDMNIMVAGSHGLGKTSFTNTLLGQPILNPQPFDEAESTRFWYNQEGCNIQISHLEAIEGPVKVRLTVIEVDGIGDSMDNRNCYLPIVSLLEDRLGKFMEDTQEAVPQLIEDTRVHVCFYFLAPKKTISDADIDTMKHIAEYTNVIPVVGKSDALDVNEIPDVGRELRHHLEKNNIGIFEDRTQGLMGPFFVICGPTLDDVAPYERSYPWGTLHLFEHEQNDIPRLRRFVFSEAAATLFSETNFFYDRFRISRLAIKLIEEGGQEEAIHIHEKLGKNNAEIAAIRERIKNKRAALENLVERRTIK